MQLGSRTIWIALLVMFHCGTIRTTSGQDLIVRSHGDSVNCRIRSESKQGIKYIYFHEGKLEDAYIYRSNVRFAQKGFYSKSFLGDSTLSQARGYPLLSIASVGGVGWFTWILDPERTELVSNHYDRLRFGTMFGVKVHFMVHRKWGVGLEFDQFQADHSVENVDFGVGEGNIGSGEFRDDLLVRYIGPSALFRNPIGRTGFMFLATGSVGPVTYRNKAVVQLPQVLSGRTIGTRFGAGFEYREKHGLGFGVHIGRTITGGANFTVQGDDSGSRLPLGLGNIDLGRTDIGIYISFSH